MSKKEQVKGFLVALIFAVTISLALRPRPPHALEVGESAWDFSVPSLATHPVRLADYRHHVVVLNFWASWCPPCVEEGPSLERFAERMRERGAVVIGVSVDQDDVALQKFVADYHLSYPIGRDPNQALCSRYGTFKFPETYILDRRGRVAEKIVGAIDWDDPRIVTYVQELAHPTEQASR